MALAEQLGTFTTLVGGPEYVHCLLVSPEAGEGPCLPLGGQNQGPRREGRVQARLGSSSLNREALIINFNPASQEWHLLYLNKNAPVFLTVDWACLSSARPRLALYV